MPDSPATVLRFGVFDFDLNTGELRKAGLRIKLQPQPARILAFLASRPGQLATREEIQAAVWGADAPIDIDQSLNFCIKQIRAALGDDPETPRYIETIPRRGYRFIGSVEIPDRQTAVPPGIAARFRARTLVLLSSLLALGAYAGWRYWLRPASQPQARVLLAVLPLDNLSGDPAQEYLSDGLTEEMIGQLGRLNPELLGVIARTSAIEYKRSHKGIAQIGRELGVEYVLEGSTRRAGNKVRVSVQLIQVKDQTHLWAETYDREVQDVLAMQADLARSVAREIGVTLAARRAGLSRPVSPEAYEAYLKGRHYFRSLTRQGLDKALQSYQAASEKDPNYAPTYAGMAEAYYALSNMHLDPREAMTKAKSAAMKALELDSTLAEAHSSLAVVKAFYELDLAGAEREFKRALELDPGWAGAQGWYGAFLAMMDRPDDAAAELERARQLDPLSLTINWTAALPAYVAGRFDEVITRTQKVLELDPNFHPAHIGLAVGYELKGDYAKAIAEYETARLQDDSPETAAFLARTLALAGRGEDARRMLNELKAISGRRYVSPYAVALIYEALGERDRAITWLEKAYESSAEGMINLKTDPRWSRMRSDPRFQNLVQRMRFPQ